jgi:hypothetical protein
MKKLLGWIREKMAIQESAPRGGMFSTSDSTVIGNNASTYNDPCVPGKDCSTTVGNGSWDIAHTSDLFSKGERPNRELSALVQYTQHIVRSSDG